MKVAIYLRVGSESQTGNEEPNILELMRDIQQYCQSKRWIKTSDYVKEAVNISILS